MSLERVWFDSVTYVLASKLPFPMHYLFVHNIVNRKAAA